MLEKIEDFKSKVHINWHWAARVIAAFEEGFPAQFHGTAYLGGEDTEVRVVNLTVQDYICARRSHKEMALFEEGLSGCAHMLHIASGEAFFMAFKELAAATLLALRSSRVRFEFDASQYDYNKYRDQAIIGFTDKRLVIKALVDLEASLYGKLQAFSFKGLKDGSVVDHSVEYGPALGLTGWAVCGSTC